MFLREQGSKPPDQGYRVWVSAGSVETALRFPVEGHLLAGDRLQRQAGRQASTRIAAFKSGARKAARMVRAA